MDTAGLPYTVKVVAHSWAAQLTLRNWILTRVAKFQSEGIVLVFWAPDPAANAVQVTFQKPGARQLAELQSTVPRLRDGHGAQRPLRLPAATRATQGTYRQVATAVLNAQSPAGASVIANPVFSAPGRTTDGSNDRTPFYGGDKILYRTGNLSQCTGGFSVNSASNPSIHYMITAAHCSYVWDATNLGHDYYTCYTTDSSGNCNYNMGPVQAVYWNADDDYELINSTTIGRSTDGFAWINRTNSTWTMNGYTDPAVDSHITWDGWKSGAVYDTKVTGVDGCGREAYGGPNTNYSGTHEVCNLVAATNNGSPPCQGGDSGGPVVVREGSTGNAEAVATVVAQTVTGCWAELFSFERSEANIRLIFG